MTAGNLHRLPPRRQIAFSIGHWRITYAGTDPRSPRTGTIAGQTEFSTRGVRVPVIADDSPSPSVSWVDDQDVIAVSAPPAGETAGPPTCPRTGDGRHGAR